MKGKHRKNSPEVIEARESARASKREQAALCMVIHACERTVMGLRLIEEMLVDSMQMAEKWNRVENG
jgi:hypothetical protein